MTEQVPLDAQMLLDLVRDAEDALQVDGWVFDDVDFWPLVRNEIYSGLFRNGVGQNEMAVPRRSAEVRRAILSLLKGGGARPSRQDVLLVSAGTGAHQMIGGELIDAYCMPVALALDRLGVTCVQAGVPDSATFDSDGKLWPVDAPLLFNKIRGSLLARFSIDGDLLDRHRALDAWYRARLGRPADISGARLASKIAAILSMATYFEKEMAAAPPRLIAMINYASVMGHALALAGTRLGIDVVEFQHGVLSPLHPSYAGWNRVPEAGYAILPSVFWAWTENDAELVQSNFASPKGRFRSVVGGNAFATAWRAGWFKAGEAVRDSIAERIRRQPARLQLLATLQPGLMSPEHLRPLLDAIRQVPDCHWWIRLHPSSTAESDYIKALLEAEGLNLCNVGDATKEPLCAWLSLVDVHLTHSSSSVLEAQEFGLKSIVWSQYGAQLFAAEELEGVAIVAPTGKMIAAELSKPVLLHEKIPIGREPETMLRTLETLLQESPV